MTFTVWDYKMPSADSCHLTTWCQCTSLVETFKAGACYITFFHLFSLVTDDSASVSQICKGLSFACAAPHMNTLFRFGIKTHLGWSDPQVDSSHCLMIGSHLSVTKKQPLFISIYCVIFDMLILNKMFVPLQTVYSNSCSVSAGKTPRAASRLIRWFPNKLTFYTRKYYCTAFNAAFLRREQMIYNFL